MKRLVAANLLAATSVLAVLWFYRWTIAHVGGLGPSSPEPAANDYYNLLVRGFTKGHLRMDVPVSEQLQALPDPYDPAQNEPYRMTDASYYRGHYYLYFGAAPAVTLLLPYRLATGEYLPTPTAILIFSSVGFLAGAAWWMLVRRRYFAALPAGFEALGILLFGIGCTAGVLLRRPFFWELATAGGFAFSMLALLALYGAVNDRRRALWTALAGLALGLAVASRPTFVFATPLLAIPLWTEYQRDSLGRRWWQMALSGATCLALIGLAVLAYNYGRFGNPLETGHNYLLSVAYESKVRLFSLEHAWFNLRMYLFRSGAWSWHPPFFAPVPVPRSEMPAGFYTVDDPFGLVNVFPAALFALCAPAALRCRPVDERRSIGLMLLTAAALGVAGAAVILLYVATIPRYAVDFLPASALLAAVGAGVVWQRGGATRWRWFGRSAVLIVALVSLLGGALTYFDAGRLLQRAEPALARRIDAVTTRVEAAIDRTRGVHYGPVEFSVEFPPTPRQRLEPLIVSGDPRAPDKVMVERLDTNRVRLGLQQGSGPIRWSRPVECVPGTTYRVRLELGSFYPELEHQRFAGVRLDQATALQHRLRIGWDGRTVLDELATFVPSRRGAPSVADGSFSGRITRWTKLEPEFPTHGLALNVSPGSGAGGALRLRVVLPPGVKNAWLPILQTGIAGAADTLSIYYMGANVVQFRFDHWGAPMLVGRSVSGTESELHTLEVFLPSFARGRFGQAAAGEMWVRWDGDEVLRGRTEAHAFTPDQFHLGENSAGAMTEDPKFRGYFASADWSGEP